MDEGPTIVVAELPCVGCGYNLRMASAEGKCPECGAAVERSLEETTMKWGSEYLRRLARSVYWGAVLGGAMPVTYILIILCADYWLRTVGVATGYTGLSVGFAVAAWRATKAPRGQGVGSCGWLIRAVAVAYAVGILLIIVPELLVLIVPHWVFGTWYMGFQRYSAVVLVVMFAGLALAARESAEFITEIDRRSGNGAHTAFGKWSLRTLACGFLLLMAADVASLVATLAHANFRSGEPIYAGLVVAGLLVGLAGLILSVVALILFSRRVKRTGLLAQAAGGVFVGAVAMANDEPADKHAAPLHHA